MARISTYSLDTDIRDNDLLIGTDGGTGVAGTSGATKNFTIGALREYIRVANEPGEERLETNLITTGAARTLTLGELYVFSVNGAATAILPSDPPDGSRVILSAVGTAMLSLYAGSISAQGRTSGDRFMAGLRFNGDPAEQDHVLIVPGSNNISFELIYIADLIQTAHDTEPTPVGWVIIN